jgi:hypothetical protein
MRRFALVATVLALLVAGCGDEDEPGTKTTISESTALPVTIERSGGVAGIHDTLVVRPDGTGTLTSRDGTTRKVAAGDTTGVVAAMRELIFDGLDERYSPPEGTMVSDGIDYTFSAWGDTITVEEMAEDVPAPLVRLKSAAARVMEG